MNFSNGFFHSHSIDTDPLIIESFGGRKRSISESETGGDCGLKRMHSHDSDNEEGDEEKNTCDDKFSLRQMVDDTDDSNDSPSGTKSSESHMCYIACEFILHYNIYFLTK